MAKKLFICLLATLHLVGCVEVQDAKKEDPVEAIPQAQPTEQVQYEDLVIDQPMHLLEGKLYTEEEKRLTEFKERRTLSEEPSSIKFKLKNLILTKNGSLQIYSNELIFDVEEVHSDGGRIFTYPPGTKAAKNTPGRDGGTVNLLANFAQGKIYLEFRGEEGGDGDSAPPDRTIKAYAHNCVYVPGKRGLDGQPAGKSGYIEAIIKNQNQPFDFRIQSFSVASGKGEPGVPGSWRMQRADGFCRDFLGAHASDGQNGADGAVEPPEESHVPAR